MHTRVVSQIYVRKVNDEDETDMRPAGVYSRMKTNDEILLSTISGELVDRIVLVCSVFLDNISGTAFLIHAARRQSKNSEHSTRSRRRQP